jgi:hypothetical protein
MRKIESKLLRISRDLINLPNSNAKHFTFICLRNKIISMGYNNGWKTHPAGARFGARFNAVHSELAAIKSFPWKPLDLPDCTWYNVRIHKDGTPAMSRPCISCQQLLRSFDVHNVFYTDANGVFRELIF